MPTVDLGPLFTPPPRTEPAHDPAADQTPRTPSSGPRTISWLRIRLTQAQWTNLAFVACACAGALFSVLYLFKGADFIQEVAAWPRELFYGRPMSARIRQDTNQSSRTTEMMSLRQAAVDNSSGDPFPHANKFLSMNPGSTHPQPNNASSLPFSAATLPLRQLDTSASGNDVLSRTLSQTAPAVASSNTPGASSATGAATTPANQNADQSIRTASTQAGSAAARTASIAKTGSLRRTAQASSVHTAHQSLKSSKPSFFKALFGFKTPQAANGKAKTTAARTRSSSVRANRAVKTANHFNSSRSSKIAASHQTSGRAGNLNGKSSARTFGITKSQAPRPVSAKTNMAAHSSPKPGAMTVSRITPSTLRTSAPSAFGTGAQTGAALRSFGSMGHGFGAGVGMSAGQGFGRGR